MADLSTEGQMRRCSIDGCERPRHGRKLCGTHYARWRRHNGPIQRRTSEDRFWEKVEKTESCWLWTACRSTEGYGKLGFDGQVVYAHRFSYELLVGMIPHGLHLDHLCRVRHCVNPGHLEPVTPRANSLRGVGPAASNATKTHCANQHPFDEANTYLTPNGARACRTCHRESERRRSKLRKRGNA